MDVLVAGGGIGGLAVARGLLADGHAVRVLEQAPAPRAGGAAVTIFANGAAALADLGAGLGELGGLIERLSVRDERGRTLSSADLRVMRRATGFAVRTVPRERLVAHLLAGLPPDTVHFGHPVTGAAVTDHRVSVTDGQGGTHTAELLVGADGYRSAVRRSLVDPAPAAANGWVTWQGLGPVLPDLAAGTAAQLIVGRAGLCGLMPAGDGLVQWWFDVPEEPDGPVVEWLRTRFAGYAEPVRELLAGVTEADVGRYPHVVHEVPDRWGRGATTLVGDAAHAFPPSQAQGANQALEDAWLLARALAVTAGDPADQLRRYEIRRARRVRRVAKLAASEVTNRPPTGARRLLGRLLTPGLAGHAYVSVIRSWSSVLNDERI